MPRPSTSQSALELPISCRSCLLRVKPAFRQFSAPELNFMTKMKLGHMTAGAGSPLLDAGAKPRLFTLYEGWAMRYRMMPDGQRQILDFILPGDSIGLGSALLNSNSHCVVALTDVSLCELDPGRIPPLFGRQPDLALSLLRGSLQEQQRADERATLLGRLSAAQRVGHLLLDLHSRLQRRDLTEGVRYKTPLRALHIADAVGLSRVHVMRGLRELRLGKLADIRGGHVHIQDGRRLARLCGFQSRSKGQVCSIL